MDGARAVRQAVLTAFPTADIRVSIVWIPMLVDDSEAAARRSAQLLAEPRVRQFYDARQEVGRVVADSLGAAGEIAWDTYLFYRPGSIWNVDPPPRTPGCISSARNGLHRHTCVAAMRCPRRFMP